MKNEEVKNEIKVKSMDILYLEYKLKIYVEREEYESAAVMKRWIAELSEKQR